MRSNFACVIISQGKVEAKEVLYIDLLVYVGVSVSLSWVMS